METTPFYSPDGSRIAWHSLPDDATARICWREQDLRTPARCIWPGTAAITELLGWADESRLLVKADSGGVGIVGAIDATSGALTILVRGVYTAVASPDGHWLAVMGQRPGSERMAWYLYPADRPDEARELKLPDQRPSRYSVFWRGRNSTATYLDTLRIINPGDTIPVDASYHLRVRGATPSGRDARISDRVPIQWAVRDTAAAQIDSLGTLHPREMGTVWVVASAGGWRTDSVALRIVAAETRPLLSEAWHHPLTQSWIPYGDPRPAIATGPNGIPGFWNRGDGSYASGAYTRNHWNAQRGLGLEARLSVPVTWRQWQRALVELSGGLDSAALGNWDHQTNGMVLPRDLNYRTCSLVYVNQQGAAARTRIALSGGAASRQIPVDPSLGDGHWFRVRIQLFPDGRCGFALDGVPMWISADPLPLALPFAVNLGYSSARTKVLIGPLEVWEGVRKDIDWSAVEGRP